MDPTSARIQSQVQQRLGKVGCVGWTTTLVVHDRHCAPLGRKPDHRLHKIRSAHSEKPGCTNDGVLITSSCNMLLADKLGSAVGRPRRSRIRLDVRTILVAGKYIVG